MQTMMKDKLKVRMLLSREEMGRAAAEDCAARLRELLAQQEYVNMIFAAAPSQNETLAALVAAPDIDWTRVRAFHMDEYVGLATGAPQTFGTYLREHIFGLVPFAAVHYLQPDAPDAKAECARYGELLEKYPADICCLGIGENGHIAFNDPGVADFDDPKPVKIATLDEVCRMQQVHDGCFPTLEAVPKRAMTLTIPSLVRAKYMFCSVPGKSKRAAIRRTLTEPITADCPATILRRHPHAILYCDRDSSLGL